MTILKISHFPLSLKFPSSLNNAEIKSLSNTLTEQKNPWSLSVRLLLLFEFSIGEKENSVDISFRPIEIETRAQRGLFKSTPISKEESRGKNNQHKKNKILYQDNEVRKTLNLVPNLNLVLSTYNLIWRSFFYIYISFIFSAFVSFLLKKKNTT